MSVEIMKRWGNKVLFYYLKKRSAVASLIKSMQFSALKSGASQRIHDSSKVQRIDSMARALFRWGEEG